MFTITITGLQESLRPNEGSFLQTPFWGEFKARHGWCCRRFLVEPEGEEGFELSVLTRGFAKGLFSLAYIPLLPVPQKYREAKEDPTIEIAHFLCDLARELKRQLPKNTLAIRLDPDIRFRSPEERDRFNDGMRTVIFADRLRLRKNAVDIQPPDSTLVDLTAPEDEILARMHSKWRYNIRLSAKKGVTVQKYPRENINMSEKIDKFYELTKETNARDGNASHSRTYYADLLASSAEEAARGKDVPQVSLYIAEHEGDEIAAIMTLFSKDEAVYLYGASSNRKRNLMPNHLLQWTAMRDAKAYGSKVYDLYGMPPEGKDESHPMHGLYLFKANFGGTNIHRTGSWDMPLRPVYGLFCTAERLRAFWHKKVLKRIRGR